MSTPERDRTDMGLSSIPETRPQLTPQLTNTRTNRPLRARRARLDGKHVCRAGWIGDEDRPAPCPVCRPHLALYSDGWRITTETERKADM
ncbi:hypothetical protein [Kocuria marina]|uniref:hypothetical protein n=1 Tax=Kocuria marina TaxID=223184 RepID=UPI0022E07F3C|nr:hypothetical protein [Kocuria marina]